MSISSLLLTFTGTLHSFIVGNTTSRPFCRYVYKCLRIFDQMWISQGGILFARAVAKATANRPQSQPPACLCTSVIFNLIAFFFEHKMRWLVSWCMCQQMDTYCHTRTPLVHPLLPPCWQLANGCGHRARFVYINSSDWMSNAHVWPRWYGGWNPPTNGICFFSSDWAADMIMSLSQAAGWRTISLSFWESLYSSVLFHTFDGVP